jgi:hypothetical protein
MAPQDRIRAKLLGTTLWYWQYLGDKHIKVHRSQWHSTTGSARAHQILPYCVASALEIECSANASLNGTLLIY